MKNNTHSITDERGARGLIMHITTMEQAYSLLGRSAIVTGGNRGIGYGIAQAFAHQGANVAIFCCDETKATEVIDEFNRKYVGKYEYYKTDITDMQNCKESVERAVVDFRGIDILVNNAGVAVVGDLLDMDEGLNEWNNCFDINLNGAVRMSYLVGKHMRERGHGRIINISSNSGEIVNKPLSMTPYNCAKAALNRLTKCLAYDWGKYNIRVNAIAPGYTNSDMTKDIPQESMEETIKKIPVGRFGNPIEIGALAVYLASDASDMMTGAVITIDGGYSLAI